MQVDSIQPSADPAGRINLLQTSQRFESDRIFDCEVGTAGDPWPESGFE